MIPSKLITKENAKKRLEQRGQDFMAIFVSGSNVHPDPKMYKYYWWIYSMESKEKSAAEVFYSKPPLKDRDNISDCIAFKYNNDNTLTKIDLDYALETNEDLEIKEQIINFIKSEKDKPIYSDILKYIVDSGGYNKDKANRIIQRGKDKYWMAIRLKQNNKLVFQLMDSKDKQDK